MGSLQKVKQCKAPYLYFTTDSYSRFRGLEHRHALTVTMHNVSRSSPCSAQWPRGQERHTIGLGLTVHLHSQRCVTPHKHPMNVFYEWHFYTTELPPQTSYWHSEWHKRLYIKQNIVCVYVYGGHVLGFYSNREKWISITSSTGSITWDGCYEMAARSSTMPRRT